MKLRTIFLVCQLIFCVFGALLIIIMSSIGIFLFIKELVDKKIIVYPKSKKCDRYFHRYNIYISCNCRLLYWNPSHFTEIRDIVIKVHY